MKRERRARRLVVSIRGEDKTRSLAPMARKRP